MPYLEIRKYTDNSLIFSGNFSCYKHCIEDAVKNKITLDHVNLAHMNLTNANLDGADMPYADFQGTNLTGANLSEAKLENSNLSNTSLYNTCLAYSQLDKCNFIGTSFGATDITGASLTYSKFSTLSCFDLNFEHAKSIHGCVFKTIENKSFSMTIPPVILKGLFRTPIIILDDIVKIGSRTFPKSNFKNLAHMLSFFIHREHYIH